MDQDSFLGTGWSFPPTFNKEQRGVEMAKGTDDIEQSLQILLGTELEERVMRPKFGANLHKFVFEQIDSNLVITITDIVRTAIIYHEARIELMNLSIDTQLSVEGLILIKIDYRVRSSNSRFNYVYPFYLNEGKTSI